MSSPALFFHPELSHAGQILSLEENTARHVVQVLRMMSGEQLQLTDGKGRTAMATIVEAGKKNCRVQTGEVLQQPPPEFQLHLGVAFTKNASRNEWLLEKATELGVRRIYPLITKRSEAPRIKAERWQGILLSAMLQSQQYYLPELTEPTRLETVLPETSELKLIAHCETDRERTLPSALPLKKSALILIGPEGDFTPDEISLAMQQGFQGLFLGHTRLRTETAAMAACAFLQLHHL